MIGFACVVRHLAHQEEGCVMCSLTEKIKSEKEKMRKPQGQEQRATGSRYGSNPIQY
ncbi:MAG: hypothetical protein ACPK85_02485 [Methanosarcina sp.]